MDILIVWFAGILLNSEIFSVGFRMNIRGFVAVGILGFQDLGNPSSETLKGFHIVTNSETL